MFVVGLGPWRSRFVSLFYFAVVFDFYIFPVSPSKTNSIGDIFVNTQNAANRSMVFFSFITHISCCRTESSCVITVGDARGRENKSSI